VLLSPKLAPSRNLLHLIYAEEAMQNYSHLLSTFVTGLQTFGGDPKRLYQRKSTCYRRTE